MDVGKRASKVPDDYLNRPILLEGRLELFAIESHDTIGLVIIPMFLLDLSVVDMDTRLRNQRARSPRSMDDAPFVRLPHRYAAFVHTHHRPAG